MRLFVALLIVLLILPIVSATDHYSFEHAQEMKDSGRIDWRDYGPDAFQEAIDENKPIFLLLTAPSWCYWCHVYTSDEYVYNEEVYPIINEQFIPIYVDADKRQDLTRKYLEGGWPSTTLLTPTRKRLHGYSGPRPVETMIANLKSAIQYVDTQGTSQAFSYDYDNQTKSIPTQSMIANVKKGFSLFLLQSHDVSYGGFGTGQKFPQARTLDWALDRYQATGDERFLQVVQNTLNNQYTQRDNMQDDYNLFDPVEGGFHRYGTTREWSPPHYEKMLYDNARLLKTYSHLKNITPDDVMVDEVVTKTTRYIDEKWYDEINGGFYGNTDVHGEDSYYGKDPRPKEKPRVEKTKYTDWNSEAIMTYLYLYRIGGEDIYRQQAKATLDLFADKMITEDGAYHYIKEGESGDVRGSLLDNSYLLLAMVDGFETLGDQVYLNKAKQLADYSLDNLYDWNSGGFFERNSPDTQLYAPGEQIDLGKPAENSVMTFALLRLYRHTKDINHLGPAIRTAGLMISGAGGLDNGYYWAKSAKFIEDNDLLKEFESKQESFESIEDKKLKDFWLFPLLSGTQEFTGFIDEPQLNGPIFILLLVALLAGLVSFLSPCTLPILPAYIAYTFRSSRKNIMGMSLAFFAGLSLVFTSLGMSATILGSWFKTNLESFSTLAGLGIMFFGLYILSGRGFTGVKIKKEKPKNLLAAFVFGGALGLSWTPCVGPILVSILILAATVKSTFFGGLLLFVYSVGLAGPLLAVSFYLKKRKDSRIWKIIKGKEITLPVIKKKIHSTTLITGLLFLMLGYLIFSGKLTDLNQLLASSPFQKWIVMIEDALLNMIR